MLKLVLSSFSLLSIAIIVISYIGIMMNENNLEIVSDIEWMWIHNTIQLT